MASSDPRTLPPPSLRRTPGRGGDPRAVLKVGSKQALTADLYHFLMVAPWTRLLLLIASVYLGLNAVFACVFLAGGDCITGARPGSFPDAFFFSVQTFSTIGYGVMSPKGPFASALVTLEAFVGLLTVAMATGLMFSKFSRPTSRVLFSDRAVITVRSGKPTLMLRMANERSNDIIEAAFRVTVLKPEVTPEGETMRRLYDLKLVRGDTPLFTITFTAIHVIDEGSPLWCETPESLVESQMRIMVTVTGLDGTIGQTIHARHVYEAPDVAWNARFVDVLSSTKGGGLVVDYTKFHEIIATAAQPRDA